MPEHNAISFNSNTIKYADIFRKVSFLVEGQFSNGKQRYEYTVLNTYVMIIMADESFLLPENSMKIFRYRISSINAVFPSPFDQKTTSSRVFIRNVD
jgi:hypothetical protein